MTDLGGFAQHHGLAWSCLFLALALPARSRGSGQTLSFEADGPHVAVGAAALLDGGSIAVGNVDGAPFLAWTDPGDRGRPIRRRLEAPDYRGTTEVRAHPLGGAVILGLGSSDGDSHAWLMRTFDRSIVWSLKLLPGERPARALHLMPDGRILVGGSVGENSAVLEFDADGNLLSARTLDMGRETRVRLVTSLAGGDRIVISVAPSLLSPESLEMCVFRVSEDGSVAWTRTWTALSRTGASNRTTPTAVEIVDTTIVVVGSDLDGTVIAAEAWGMGIGLDGTVSWSWTGRPFTPSHLTALPDGGMVLAADHNDDVAPLHWRAELWHLRADGMPDGAYRLFPGELTQVHQLAAAGDDGLTLLRRTVSVSDGWEVPGPLDFESFSLEELLTHPCGVEFSPLVDAPERDLSVVSETVTVGGLSTVPSELSIAARGERGAQTPGCLAPCPLDCAGGSNSNPTPGCIGENVELTLSPEGSPPFMVQWDLDGDGAPDPGGPTGLSVTVTTTAEAQTVLAWVGDDCTSPDLPCMKIFTIDAADSPPGEVSDVRGGALSLRLSKSSDRRIQVGAMDGALGYRVQSGLLGEFASPAPPPLSTCGAPHTRVGGTVDVEHELSTNSWVIVTAWNLCNEGPAGSGSDDEERSTRTAWKSCGL